MLFRGLALARRVAPAACVLALTLPSRAGEPSFAVRHFNVAEGLAHERVNCIAQDAKGWVWFGTWEGLSRFDGVAFENFGERAGLETPFVNTIAIDREGQIWVGLNGGGIARFLDDPRERKSGDSRRFETFRLGSTPESNNVDTIVFDTHGRMWCGSQTGLYCAPFDGTIPGAFTHVYEQDPSSWAQGPIVDTARNRIWFACNSALVAVDDGDPGQRPLRELVRVEPLPVSDARSVAMRRNADGSLAVAARTALYDARIDASGAIEWSARSLELPETQPIHAMLVARDGTTWIGTQRGLVQLSERGRTTWFDDAPVFALLEDRESNVWAGTWSDGVRELVPSLVRSWKTADGLPDRNAQRVIDAGNGRMVVTTEVGMAIIAGGRVTPIARSTRPEFYNVGLRILHDRRGRWWLGTDRGVYVCDGPELDLERARLVDPDRGAHVFGALLEDRNGDVLFGDDDGKLYAVATRDDGDYRIRRIGPDTTAWPTQIRELHRDSTGALWLAPYTRLFRVRGDEVQDIGDACKLGEFHPRCFHEDQSGRLWIGTRRTGLWCARDLGADVPRIERIPLSDEPISEAVWSIAEDARGRLWLATGRGLVRLDPDSKRIARFGTREGLAGDIVAHCMCDAEGRTWAATSGGISVVDGNDEPALEPVPPVYIARVRIAGADVPLPATGTRTLPALELDYDRNDLEIEFESPAFGSRKTLWQYRLGSDAWSTASAQRSVRFARLSPGDYRFEVRAVGDEGAPGTETARVEFEILPPFWQRGWFIASAACCLALAGYAVHRARLNRALALARIRSQIAADLHDDLGAGLSQIAILSEVARREPTEPSRGHLEEIAGLARSLRESVGEIVWAIDPRKDHLRDLVARMRQVAFNLLESEGLDVDFRAPDDATIEAIGLAPDQRRHLLLVLKEALSNVARHARATRAEIELSLANGRLVLTIRDDGRGFDPSATNLGHGLASLKRRATELSADIDVRSAPGSGTTVVLSMSIRPPHIRAVAARREPA